MSHFLGLAAAFAAIEVAQGNAGIMLRWCLLHAIDCVPHARPPRRRYLRMVGFRVFDYVYKHVRPYIVFVPGLTMYKHLRTFRWRGFTMGTILRARSCKHIFSQLVDFPYHCYLFYRDLDLAWPYLSFLHALRATSCMYVGIVGRRCLI